MDDIKDLLMSYIRANVTPILVDFIFGSDFPDAIVIPATISLEEFNGYYEETTYMPPKWYKKLINSNSKLLIIDLIDSVEKDEQLKFVELLKYRKVSTFELNDDCVILVTAKKISQEKISEEIYSLVAQVRG